MFDDRSIGTHFNQPTLMVGRFAGAGASVPTPITNVNDSQPSKVAVTQAATGNYVVTFLDLPLGTIQSYDFWVASNNVADRNVRITPPTVGSYAIQLNVTFMANGTACNVAAGEELVYEVWFKRSQAP